ncbi:hypothetical protein ACJJTC_003607 [Scirpophaga incertulas]
MQKICSSSLLAIFIILLIEKSETQTVQSNTDEINLHLLQQRIIPDCEQENIKFSTVKIQDIPVAIPVPVPIPVQIALPPVNLPTFCEGKSCPACPPCLCAPSCTPSFFSYCSRCHQKCRCRNKDEVPQSLHLDHSQQLKVPVISAFDPVLINYPLQVYDTEIY